MITSVSIIGTGNVATHLALSLHRMGVVLENVIGRDIQQTQLLADRVEAVASNHFDGCVLNSNFIIVAVNDDAYSEVISKIKIKDSSIIVHTSGSLPMNVFETKFSNYGVFYPLQSFTINREVRFDHVPLCIEASSSAVYEQLRRLSGFLSEDVRNVNSIQRAQIHLAAVFCNNFSNYMYTCAQELLQNSNVPFDILNPLILESAQKAVDIGPENAQTGPSKRGDFLVINKHLEMIENPNIKDLYSMITNQIYNKNNS